MTSALSAVLQRRPVGTIRLGLVPIRRLLARLGNPHQRLAVVHVAGTNGKGSVIAFLESILLKAGIPVAAFTSPHLARFNERIRLNGQEIADDQLDGLLKTVLSLDPQEETTFFELTTAAALLYFARARLFDRHRGGVVLLETGLGGRLDATNLVRPLLSVLTSIGMDHEDFLGHTVLAIAREKCGILKAGVPAIAADNGREVNQMVVGMAAKVGAPLQLARRDFFFTVPSGGGRSGVYWHFRQGDGARHLPVPGLRGDHQFANAALAVAAVQKLQQHGYLIADAALKAGIAQACWPGRLECFPGSPPVWLDGAHNPDAMRALVRFLRTTVEGASHRVPTILVFSVMNNKDAVAMVGLLAPWVDLVFTVCCGGERGRSAEALVGLWSDVGVMATYCVTVQEALTQAYGVAFPTGRVVVTGSLFLVGEARILLSSGESFIKG